MVRVGCSGWNYKHWRGVFYPAGLPVARWLDYYTRHFDTVEINNSFYRLPARETFVNWRRQTPASFLFAVKASRFLTHMRKLKEPQDPLALFFKHARGLREKLGPVLYQLPPRWKLNLERLQEFLRAVPKKGRHAIEFREPGWYDERALELLARYRVALCLHDMPGSASGHREVGPFRYIRFHGSEAKYKGGYRKPGLIEWAVWIAQQAAAGRDVYVYFNNDVGGHAIRDAMTLKELLARRS